jgi:hypothetical protein
MGWGIGAATVLLVIAFAAAPTAGASASSSTPALFHSITSLNSTNWAGYAALGAKGSVTDVKGSWIEPKISKTCPTAKNEYAAFWVGIDGVKSPTVEQTGTDSDCQGGSPTYYAWYEFYPNPSYLISSVPISPGNVISGEVKFSGGKFTVTLSDLTTGKSFSKSATVSSASRNSAEWVAEAPSSSSGVLPLAPFGSAQFGADHSNVTGTCAATISGSTHLVGAFGSLDKITMVNNAGTAVKASVSAVSSDKSSFTVKWLRAGP